MPEVIVPVPALRTAWDLVLTLGNRSSAGDASISTAQRIAQAVESGEAAPDHIWLGLVWLVEALSAVVMNPEHPVRAEAEPGEIIEAILEKLEAVPGLPASDDYFTSVESAMLCAERDDLDAVQARQNDMPGFGPISEDEAAFLAHAAWFIADLNDAVSGVPHLTAQLMGDALDQLDRESHA